MKYEIAVGSYEGNLQVWHTHYVELPDAQPTEEALVAEVSRVHPDYDPIAFVHLIGEAVDTTECIECGAEIPNDAGGLNGYHKEDCEYYVDHDHPETTCLYRGMGIWNCGVVDQS